MKLTLENLPEHVDQAGNCWLWKRGVNGRGYPQANLDGVGGGVMVRRYVAVLAGWVPTGRTVIGSTCGNATCCKPAHLVPKSRSRVLTEAYASGNRKDPLSYADRLARRAGLPNMAPVLTPDQRAAMRAYPPGSTYKQIAQDHGVRPQTVSDFLKGKTYRTELNGASVFTWRPA